MASVHPRTNRAGEVSYYQVKWRDGGTRKGGWQSESFDDPEDAKDFKVQVDEAGQHWPPGWVKGRGYIAAEAATETAYRFKTYATNVITNKTGIEERYRKDCLRDLEAYIFPVFGECDVRSTEHFSSDTVAAWLRKMELTKVWRGAELKKMSPKTIRNLHGLLSSILERAVLAEPPLRDRNPCKISSLPRTDDEIDDEMCFLTPQEVDGLLRCFPVRQDQLLVAVAYGTGMRYGELTALKPGDVIDRETGKPKIRVQRAWKRDEEGGYFLGKPKTKKSRRSIRISRTVLDALVELGLDDMKRDELLFTGSTQNRLHYSTFGDRWTRAVRLAQASGLLPEGKRPTPHDLRHSHVAVLISALPRPAVRPAAPRPREHPDDRGHLRAPSA